MSETPESDTQSVAPLEFSYGKWRNLRMAPSYGSPQGFLPPRVAPLEFSYGKWRNLRMAPSYGSPQGFLPPRVAPLEFSYGKWRRDTPI